MRPREQQSCHLASTPHTNSGGCEMGGGVVGFTDSTLGVWPQFGITWELLNLNFSAQVVLPTRRRKALAHPYRPFPNRCCLPGLAAGPWRRLPEPECSSVCSVKGNSREKKRKQNSWGKTTIMGGWGGGGNQVHALWGSA